MRAIDALDRIAWQYPDRVFVQQGGVAITYREACAWTHRIAARLQAMGVPEGTRVAFLSVNDWRGLLFMYGTWRAGLVLVPVNVRNSAAMNVAILKRHRPSALVFHGAVEALASDVLAELPDVPAWCCLDRESLGLPPLERWMAPEGSLAAEAATDPLAPWTLYSTSGTTGASKGVLHTHLSNYVTSMDMLFAMRVHEPKRHLVVAPMTHFAGSFIFALTVTGSTHYLMDKADPAEVLDQIERHRIQVLFLPPTVIYLLLAHPALHRHDYGSLQHFVYAAAPMATGKLREAMATFGTVMMNMYGQAEAIGPIMALSPEDHGAPQAPAAESILRSIGTPALSRQVRIMRDDGELAAAGEPGEVVLRDWVSRSAYHDDEAATAEVHRGGWYHTGDVGVMDDAGRVTLLDRKKDIIITGGFNVFSAGVEQCLMVHPAVLEATVFGIPDEKWGEAVHAMVERKPGRSVDADELRRLVREQLGAVSAPKSVDFVEQLPRSATGKVLKRELRASFWQGRDRLI